MHELEHCQNLTIILIEEMGEQLWKSYCLSISFWATFGFMMTITIIKPRSINLSSNKTELNWKIQVNSASTNSAGDPHKCRIQRVFQPSPLQARAVLSLGPLLPVMISRHSRAFSPGCASITTRRLFPRAERLDWLLHQNPSFHPSTSSRNCVPSSTAAKTILTIHTNSAQVSRLHRK